jgi:spore coat protein CotH
MRALCLILMLAAGCGGDSSEGGGSATPPPPPPGPTEPDPFDDSVLATYAIDLDLDDWDAMVDDPFDDTWRHCTVTWQDEVYADVAIRPSGERSRIPGNPKPSVRLEFDEFVPDREFHDYSTIKLDSMYHDESMMRARLQYPVYVALGVPAPKYVHARLYVNGDYKGLYGVEERISREFLRRRLGQPVNQLYEWMEAVLDVEWLGPDYQYVPRMWEPKIEELPAEAAAVRDLVDILNNNPAAAEAVFDVNSFVAFIAAEVIAGEGDAYLAGREVDRTENMYLYRSPVTGKFMFLPWDRDQGFYRDEQGITFGFDRHILTQNLILSQPAKLALYRQLLRQLIDGAWATAVMQARVDAIWAQIQAAAEEDALKPYSMSSTLYRIGRIKEYIEERNAAFLEQLNAP